MIFLKGFIIWLVLMLVESLHGMARMLWLVPRIGDLPARQISLLTGSLLILVITVLFVRWLHASRVSQLIGVGLLWAVLTIGFEIGLGRMLGYSWERIGSDYNLLKGGFMAFGLVWLTFSPLIAARLRGVLPRQRVLS
ncbi:hypothetical protein H6G89_28930 [Oscillatoria sp. FACHB-1407]|uniref:hypothetical protein n=1 Tax=Oscillatoria sp. FACHB-1407 TaxID=2692847 RepID=UPI0016830975|nr:hypothetical protein [Oscillatoria sp. FACHB-1407]MBD2465035.1 hypothetical protein [Oscillatoria sp. FACHB-1407]